MKKLILFLPMLIIMAACGKDDDEIGTQNSVYPSIINEFALIKTDSEGKMVQFTTDYGKTYFISNSLTGFYKNVRYRAVCGYVPSGQSAHLYQMTTAYLLRDSTRLGIKPDPISVTSVWRTGNFINMQLAPLTQGQDRQFWGYRLDSIRGNTTHISLHHRQNGDPLSYTQTTYASIPIDSLKIVPKGDSIALHIATFNGDRVWSFKR